MKYGKLLIVGMVLVLSAMGAKGTFAADVTGAVDVNSAYVWRGITFNDGLVVQPSLDVTAGNFGVNVWGNIDIDDYDNTLDAGEFSEVDITLTYSASAGPLGITGGYIEYLFPETDMGGAPGTREVFLDLSAAPADGFSVGLTGYYDFDEVDDYYLNAYLGYGIALDSGVALDMGASAGYAGDDMAAGGEAGFHEYTLTLAAGYAVTEQLALSATLGYTDSLDTNVLPDQDVNLFGGAGIAYSF